MILTPRYDGPPVLRFRDTEGDLAVPLLRQRRRLGEVLAGFDDAQWATPSRCDAWTVRDVVAHLVGADQFWALSAMSALAGEPTRYLVGFDPVATPAQMVEGTHDLEPGAVLDRFLTGVEALAGVVGDLDAATWSTTITEAPPGHVALDAWARHALWDAWIHERDILLPLGLEQVLEADEVRACLEYAAGIGPTFLVTTGSARPGGLVVDGSSPDIRVVVELGTDAVEVRRGGDAPEGAVRLAGPSVELVDALTCRAPFPCEVSPADRWILSGVETVFDVAPTG